ncbi:MAG: exopolysaccharide biosynthesis polyprenyl glycosylphosphotransferase, partial [Acutalibacteraceae bacterium]
VHDLNGIAYLGDFKSVSRFFEKCPTDEAIIMLSDKEQKRTEQMVALCETWGIKFSIIPNIFSTFSSRIYISSFDGMPVLSMRRVPLDNAFNSFVKRLFDIVISLIMLIVLSPLMAVVAIIIKATSPGHVIFKQERIGLGRKPFVMYKFRSMREDSESDLSMTEENDPRCTKIGHFIRKYSIDELPQLVNVLKGDMSLVGPRPEIPFYVKQFRKSVPLYMVKHYVKPGMTGWAQVNGLRGNDTSIEERIKYDIYYIEHWSVAFDIKILFETLFKGIFSRNAH